MIVMLIIYSNIFVKINEMGANSFLDIRYEIAMQVLFGIVFLTLGLYFSKIRQKV